MEVCGEEAATAFLEACRPWNSDNLIDEVRKGLTAALPHLPGVGVKKLEWNEDPEENRWNSYHAFGQEQIIWDPRASEETSFGWFNCGKRVWFGSIDEAKAAAQADYSARILSALEPSAARELALEALNTAYASMEGSCSANHRIAMNTVDAAIRSLGTSREQLNKAVSNVPDQQENEPGAHGERERALEEAAKVADELEERTKLKYASPDGEECQIVPLVLLIEAATAIRALSSPDHAEAGKVEGDGLREDVAKVYAWLREPDWDEEWDFRGWLNRRPSPNSFALIHEQWERSALPSAPSQEVAGS